jgi:Uma2 family endonuclease
LESGDRLTRAEFERRWEAMPQLKHAELIEGVVYMNAAVSVDHGFSHAHLTVWLGVYAAATPGVQIGAEPSVILSDSNMPQPDCLLMVDPARGGQARIADDYVHGAPELAAEVATSSASYDLNQKLEVYRRFGVREYIVWRTYDQAIDWFVLREGRYEPMATNAAGRLESTQFPGLWLDVAAMLRGDLQRVLNVLQEGIATPAHAGYVQQLASAKVQNP